MRIHKNIKVVGQAAEFSYDKSKITKRTKFMLRVIVYARILIILIRKKDKIEFYC